MIFFTDEHRLDLQAVGQANEKFFGALVIDLAVQHRPAIAFIESGNFFAISLGDVAPGGGVLAVLVIDPLKSLAGRERAESGLAKFFFQLSILALQDPGFWQRIHHGHDSATQ